MNKINNLSSILKDYNYNFIKKTLIRVIKVSWICALIFTAQISILYIFYPVLINTVIMFWLFSIALSVSYYISLQSYKNSYHISATILFITDFVFINCLILFSNSGLMSIYNPGVSYVFMMFIAFTVFTPNFISALTHSFAYATCSTFYYLYGFSEAQLILNDSWYKILEASKFTYPLAYYMTATIVTFYVWYRDNKYSSLRNIIYKSLITSLHERLISEEAIENDRWDILTALININEDYFGGDFIASRKGEGYIELFIGDVMDHGIDTSQIAFGLLSIFHSKAGRHPEEILLNCNSFLLKIGEDLGGLSYVSLIRFMDDGQVEIYGSTGINPQLVTKKKVMAVKTDNFVLGSSSLNINEIKPIKLTLKKTHMIIIKTDGWDSEFDEKASIVATYN